MWCEIPYASKRMNECNKCTTALISTAYRAPGLSLKVRRLVKVTQSKDYATFPRIAARFAELRHVWRKKCSNTIFRACRTNPEANHKSAAHFLSKCGTQISQIGFILFDAYCTCMVRTYPAHPLLLADLSTLSSRELTVF